jgi:hypothetical protein
MQSLEEVTSVYINDVIPCPPLAEVSRSDGGGHPIL